MEFLQDISSSYALQRAPKPPVVLSFHDALKNKAIITTAEGTRLGVADGAIIDSSAMTLEAIAVADSTMQPSSPGLCIPTATLTQVGDVILVNEERSLRRPPAIPEFVAVLGVNVRSARGQYIGRVKDIDFDPDTGAISAIYYDEYGLSWLPLSLQLVNLYGVPTEAVLDVRSLHLPCDACACGCVGRCAHPAATSAASAARIL
jgi:sporulation protein YlmC with PRC-barrel domain